MKWFVVAVVLAVIPLLIVWTRAQPRLLPWVWGLVAFLPFVTDYLHLYFAVASWAGWPGHTKGVELTLIDFLVLMLFLSDRQPNRRFAFIWPMAAYAGVVLLSVMQSLQAQPVIFYFWQLLRMLLLAIAVARASQNPGVVPGILWGLAAGIFLEAAMTPLQHGSGDLQTTGTFVHQNLLGLMSNSIAMIFFAVFMAKPNLKCLAVVVAAALIAVLTASRATQG